jgi:hypothetical protein
MKLWKLVTAVRQSWDKNTSYYEDWTIDNPAYGQCAVTALVVQDYLGGIITSCFVNKMRHYCNVIDNKVYDLTVSQFHKEPVYEKCIVVEREQLLKSKQTKLRYELLKSNVERNLQ